MEFVDNLRRRWCLKLDGPRLREVKQRDGVDLVSDDGWRQVDADLLVAAGVLWTLCRDQANQRGLSERDFQRGFPGAAIKHATAALAAAVASFFPTEQQLADVAPNIDPDDFPPPADDEEEASQATPDYAQLCYEFAGNIGIRPDGLTLAELWDMHHGKLRAARQLQVSQATLFFVSMSAAQVAEFVRSGYLDGSSEPPPDPYDQATVKAMAVKMGQDKSGKVH